MLVSARGLALLLILLASPLRAQAPPPAPFIEDAIGRGISGVVYLGHWTGPWGAGVALNDLDGDGDADCVVTVEGAGVIHVYENDGSGTFTEHLNLPAFPVGAEYSGVTAADYDGDGDLDLHIGGYEVPNRLLRNDGAFSFTDVTDVSGLGNVGFATGVVWGDVDGDGWLDLYLCNRTRAEENPSDATGNALYINDGDGTFTDVSVVNGVDDPWKSFQPAFYDHDLDGDLDLYVANDKADGEGTNHNRLFENVGGTFVEISAAAGADEHGDYMGLDTGDFDGDGDFDVYSTNVPTGNLYLVNDGDGTYTESALGTGVASFASGWAALFWDFDNDSWNELYVANSIADNRLYWHGGTFPAVDIAAQVAIHDAGYAPPSSPGSAYCAAIADIDLDGDLDMLVQSWNEPFALYINQEGTNRNHLRVVPRQPGPNVFAVGAVVQVTFAGNTRREQIRAGRGYKSSSELVAHFGLGLAPQVDELLIRWPDTMLTRLVDIPANQVITVERTAHPLLVDCNLNLIPDIDEIAADPGLDSNGDGTLDGCESPFRRGDANTDGVIDIADPIAALAHLFSGLELNCGSALDANDDGLIDIGDPIALLGHIFGGAGGPGPIPAPFGVCGLDPTPDPLDCESSPSCP